MLTVQKLAKWLEEDGHPGCADDLLAASPEDQPRVAREIADHCEQDAIYDDAMAKGLPSDLRTWASDLNGQAS